MPVGVTHPLKGGEPDKPGEAQGTALAGAFGATGSPAEQVAALRALTPEALLEARGAAIGPLAGKGNTYGVCVDGAVFPEAPLARLLAGRHHRVPVMVGANADEMTFFASRVKVRRAAGYRWAVRRFFGKDADALLRLFPPGDDPQAALTDLLGVVSFVAPARMVARASARVQPQTWYYHFSRVPPIARRTGKGATHGLEIGYIFGTSKLSLTTDVDRALAGKMRAAWVAFARTGDPNSPALVARWPPHDAQGDAHLEFGDTVRAGSGLHREACDIFARQLREKAGWRE